MQRLSRPFLLNPLLLLASLSSGTQSRAEDPCSCPNLLAAKKILMPTGALCNLSAGMNSTKFKSTSDGVERTLYIYVPKSISEPLGGDHPRKTLLFMHGGGAERGSSTATEPQAQQVTQMYLDSFYKAYAEKNKVMVIAPTSSVGWSYHTSFLFRNLLQALVAKGVPVDPNYLVLTGHSMGGMGITREYPSMTDLFSGVLGQSAGMSPALRNEDAYLPILNGTPYYQLNGREDHFKHFLPQMEEFNAWVKVLEEKYKHQSHFKLLVHSGGHHPPPGAVDQLLNLLFETKRNRFPKYIQTTFSWGVYPEIEYPTFTLPRLNGVQDKKYWIELKGLNEPKLNSANTFAVRAEVQDQTITISSRVLAGTGDLSPQEMELTLSNQLIDTSRPVRIIFNQQVKFDGMLDTDSVNGDAVIQFEPK